MITLYHNYKGRDSIGGPVVESSKFLYEVDNSFNNLIQITASTWEDWVYKVDKSSVFVIKANPEDYDIGFIYQEVKIGPILVEFHSPYMPISILREFANHYFIDYEEVDLVEN